MTEVQAVLLLMTAACIATGVALHRNGALSAGGLAAAVAAALVIGGVMFLTQ